MASLSDAALNKDIAEHSGSDGSIEIRDAQVMLSAPQGFGRFPAIMPGEHVEIYVNGRKVGSPTIVSNEDQVVIKTIDIQPVLELDLEMTEDKMQAYLIIKKKAGKRFLVKDCQPVHQCLVTAKFVQEIEPGPVELEQIMELLSAKGIIYGIKKEEIDQVLKDERRVIKVEIARGLMPSGVEDAAVVYSFSSEQPLEQSLNPYGEGRINSVTVGDILAIKKQAVAGVPGIDVTGQPVPPPPPKDEDILIKDGVKLIKEASVAVATISGRPVLEGLQRKVLSVRPVHIVKGDVNLEVGNINFKGDIVVTGSVQDGFRLEAGGNIEVFGDVHWADLYASGNITIHKKAITANIQAGGLTVVYKEIFQILHILALRFASLVQSINILRQQPAFSVRDLEEKGVGQLVQLLLDMKYSDIPKTIAKLTKIIRETHKELASEVAEVEQALTVKLCNLGPLRLKEYAELEELALSLQKTVERVEVIVKTSCNVTIGYVQNSKISASGNIEITGQGSITSELDAGDSIFIKSGAVRGGQLKASRNIKIRELGSGSHVEVKITMLDNCRLEAEAAHPVAVIKHGTETVILEENCRNLQVYVAKEGYFVVKKQNMGTRL